MGSSIEEVLVRANEARSILKTIWCRKHGWLGHVLRHDNLLHDIIEEKMLGKATRGRKRIEFTKTTENSTLLK